MDIQKLASVDVTGVFPAGDNHVKVTFREGHMVISWWQLRRFFTDEAVAKIRSMVEE